MLQLGDSRVGDPGVRDVATFQVGKFLEIHCLAIGERSWPEFQVSDGLIIGGVVTWDRFDFQYLKQQALFGTSGFRFKRVTCCYIGLWKN